MKKIVQGSNDYDENIVEIPKRSNFMRHRIMREAFTKIWRISWVSCYFCWFGTISIFMHKEIDYF